MPVISSSWTQHSNEVSARNTSSLNTNFCGHTRFYFWKQCNFCKNSISLRSLALTKSITRGQPWTIILHTRCHNHWRLCLHILVLYSVQAVDLWQKDSYSVLATKLKFFIVTFCIFLLLIIFKSGAFYDIGGRRSRLMVSRCVLPPFESTLPRISWSVFSPVHHIHSTKSYKINGLTLISFLQDRGLTSVEPSHLYDSMFFQGVWLKFYNK